jgi:predicted RNA-binding Zn-ribbon protein involved in translation (DUF1610 family)
MSENHEGPDPSCKHCQGTGRRRITMMNGPVALVVEDCTWCWMGEAAPNPASDFITCPSCGQRHPPGCEDHRTMLGDWCDEGRRASVLARAEVAERECDDLRQQLAEIPCSRCGYPGGAASWDLLSRLADDRRNDRAAARHEAIEECAQFLDDHAKGYEDRAAAFSGGANDATRIPSALARELREKAGGLRQMKVTKS